MNTEEAFSLSAMMEKLGAEQKDKALAEFTAEELEAFNNMTVEEAVKIAYSEGEEAALIYDGLFMYALIPDKFKDNDEVFVAFTNGKKEHDTLEMEELLPLYIEHVKAGEEDKTFNPRNWDMYDEPPYAGCVRIWKANPTPELVAAIEEAEKTIRERKHDIGKKLVHRSAVLAVSTSSLMHDEINANGVEKGMDEVIAELKTGNMDYLLKSLIGNITNINVDMAYIQTPEKATYKLKKEINTMKVKLLQEQRKSVMAINEIMNPKRTTFVKNAIQNVTNTADVPEQVEHVETVEAEVVPEIATEKVLKKAK